MKDFNFKVTKLYPKTWARLGVISTAHGKVNTPCFIPVSTSATVKSLSSIDLEDLGAQCTLSNTYHLHLRPGEKVIKKLGGLHGFMNYPKPIFTDSGGFQAFSLGAGIEHNVGKMGSVKKPVSTDSFAKVTDKGVHFKSIYDGTKHFLDAKKSMKIQSDLGADVIMAFDECTSPTHDYEYNKIALERTNDWAKKSLKYLDKKQALYGIIQGSRFKDLRIQSAKFTNSLPFDGIAIGGSFGDAYGDSKKSMHQVLEWVIPLLDHRPRHMLGIGGIDDIFECVQRGIDTFDCVHPTRIARRGNLYICPESGGNLKNKFRISIKNTQYRQDKKPIDTHCNCSTCKNFSKAYLRHLYVNNEIAYHKLAVIHNIYFMLSLMKEIRASLKDGSFEKLKKKWLK